MVNKYIATLSPKDRERLLDPRNTEFRFDSIHTAEEFMYTNYPDEMREFVKHREQITLQIDQFLYYNIYMDNGK